MPKKLLKMKLFSDAEAEVIGTMPGNPHTKNEGRLGALVCRAIKGGPFPEGVTFEVGGGFNPDSLRDVFWAKREGLVGKIVNFAYFGITDAGCARHPQFRFFREEE